MMAAKHPRELFLLSAVQVFERFSFYGVAAILVTFLTDHIHYSDSVAFEYFGCFMTLSYGFSLLSGWLADRYLGKDLCIILGLVTIPIGCLLLANHQYALIPIGLATIALGVGFFKPNLSALLGQMYADDDERLESAYTIFYMGINIGALLGIVIIGIVARYSHWYYSFIITAVVSVIGLLLYLLCRRQFISREKRFYPSMRDTQGGLLRFVLVLIAASPLVFLGYYLIKDFSLTGKILYLATAICIGYLVLQMRKEPPIVIKRIIVILLLVIVYTLFSAAMMQSMTSITLFSDRNVNRDVFGFIFPASSLEGLNPTMVLIIGPLVIMFWQWVRRRASEPRDLTKFAWGLFSIALSFFVLYVAALVSEHNELGSSLWWLVLTNLLSTVGELFISPVGITSVKRLAPNHLLSMLMSIWFLGAAYGSYLSAYIAKFTSAPVNHAMLKATITAQIYAKDFLVLGFMVLGMTVFTFILSKFAPRQQ